MRNVFNQKFEDLTSAKIERTVELHLPMHDDLRHNRFINIVTQCEGKVKELEKSAEMCCR